MSLESPIQDSKDVRNTIYVAFVGFTILVWDHLDTFTMEVEYIWPRIGEKRPIVYLFLVNRYLTPLGFIVNLFAFLSPSMNSELESCKHFVRFEGAMTMIGINIVGLMMLVRIYALYHRQPWVVRSVAALLLVEIGVYAWLLSTGIAVSHAPGTNSCTMIFGESNRLASTASAWLPLLYDTVVVALTLRKTLPSIKGRNQGQSTMYVMKRLLEDGLLYYGVIFAVTATLTIMIAVAPAGLKNVVAQLELLITVTMMSRITLNLMKSHVKHQRELLNIARRRSPLQFLSSGYPNLQYPPTSRPKENRASITDSEVYSTQT
jgi:hypothetical protein